MAQQPGPQAREPAPKDFVLSNFGGMNQSADREEIADEEFFWLENVHPIAAGNLKIIRTNAGVVQQIAGQTVIQAKSFYFGGQEYNVLIMSSGHAYIVQANSPFSATQITATLGPIFSASTRMTSWAASGVLFIDPTAGYFDYNVTIANTLTAISNAVISALRSARGTGYTTVPTLTFTGGGATTQAAANVDLQTVGSAVVAGGLGYLVGDILTVVGGTFTAAETVRVATIGGGGVVTLLTPFNANDHYTVAPGAAAATTGGSGAGCTVTLTFGIGQPVLTSSGSGYTAAPVVTVTGGGGAGGTVSATISGSTLGTAIAAYAGRVWIANLRTITFTDVASYNSFGGAGGSLTIDDETLSGNITALFAANGYLYIFGADSIDILGDVQVSGGVTSFSRQNITASVGTIFPTTIFSYYRSIIFTSSAGFYQLTGSTPQKISDKIDSLFEAIDLTKPMSGGQVMINNILCPAFSFFFTDNFTPNGGGGSRPIIAMLSRGKWFTATTIQTFSGTVALIVSFPNTQGISTLNLWDNAGGNSNLRVMFSASGGISWTVMTKLWDGTTPVLDKQIINAGIGVRVPTGISAVFSGTTITTATEYVTQTASTILTSQNPGGSFVAGYSFNAGKVSSAGGTRFGMNIQVTTSQIVINRLATQFLESARWSYR